MDIEQLREIFRQHTMYVPMYTGIEGVFVAELPATSVSPDLWNILNDNGWTVTCVAVDAGNLMVMARGELCVVNRVGEKFSVIQLEARHGT